jgi:hypothetical protein
MRNPSEAHLLVAVDYYARSNVDPDFRRTVQIVQRNLPASRPVSATGPPPINVGLHLAGARQFGSEAADIFSRGAGIV